MINTLNIDGNIIQLTAAQVADFKQQLQTQAIPKLITERIQTIEDAYKDLKMENEHFYPKHDGDIAAYPQSKYRPSEYMTRKVTCAFAVKSEKRAKSLLAFAKLTVIADALNEGWKPDYSGNNSTDKWVVYYTHEIDRLNITSWRSMASSPIVFISKELAEYCIAQFQYLWKAYFMLS